jgi:hypothetical protein
MNNQQKTFLKGICGFLFITFGLFSEDKLVADLAFSGGAALIISATIDLLNQNGNKIEVPS